ncbi:carbon-nitrogen hydrolase family protein [Streptomyces sp. NBC_00075]|uniref:carbon-nitrogen hydrolase family protein n=1 Tax=Streptomyces sp. NBC_00075 TaxID=2975641 RepID=UPI003245E764
MSSVVRVAAVQAEPKWLDLDAGVDHAVDLIAQAAAGGAELVAFPEVFLPGYPWWIWLDSPLAGMQYVPRYADNSMTRDGEHLARIAAAAAEHRIFVVLGFAERTVTGSLYMAQATIDDTGRVLAVRRKLKPTHAERTVFGEGDGSDIQVHETRLGRLGALNCAEHIQPLTKYTMYSKGEQIHVASWPSFSVYRGMATALGPEVNTAVSLVYAVEGQTFVLAPCATVGQAGQDLFCDTDAKRELLLQGGGFTRIYGPEGTELAKPLPETEEGILYADLDSDLLAIAKHAYDPAGHYSRPDVFRLTFNPNATHAVQHVGPTGDAAVTGRGSAVASTEPAESGTDTAVAD